jgi:hypothetical protein
MPSLKAGDQEVMMVVKEGGAIGGRDVAGGGRPGRKDGASQPGR